MDSPLFNMVLTCKAGDSPEENSLHVYSVWTGSQWANEMGAEKQCMSGDTGKSMIIP